MTTTRTTGTDDIGTRRLLQDRDTNTRVYSARRKRARLARKKGQTKIEALDHAVNNMSYIEEEVTRIESDRGRYYMDDFCLNVQLVDQLTI